MRALRWFILGSVAGLMLGLVVLSSLYLSPWRQSIYLHADPKVSATRQKLHEFQAQIRFQENRMAFAGDSLASLQASQTKAWQEYKTWRNRFGQMANAHKKTTPGDFLLWSRSLIAFVIPGVLFFFFGGGLLALFAIMRHQERQPRIEPRPRRTVEPSETTQGMDQFQEAVRRIADIQSRSPIRQKSRAEVMPAQPTVEKAHETTAPEPSDEPPRYAPIPQARPAAMGPVVASPWATPSSPEPSPPASQQPLEWKTVESQLPPGMSLHPPRALTPEDTTYLDVLSGWEDMAQTAQSEMPEIPPRQKSSTPSPSAFLQDRQPPEYSPLTMQDEDTDPEAESESDGGGHETSLDLENPYAVGGLDENEPPYGRMPETTEFEKLERQKSEVVKLARKGLTSSEISRRLKMSEDQVELIVRMRRERG